jgi:hypothetical protein
VILVPPVGEVGDELRQHPLVDGFGQVVVHALANEALPLTGNGMGGDRDDGGLGVEGVVADRLGGADAVHDGHLDIHEDDVERLALGQVDRLLAVLAHHHLGHHLLEHGGDELEVGGVVIHRQHLDGLHAARPARAGACGVPPRGEQGVQQFAMVDGLGGSGRRRGPAWRRRGRLVAAEQHYGVLLAVQSVETGNHLLRAVQGAAADEHHVLAAHRGPLLVHSGSAHPAALSQQGEQGRRE